MRNTERKDETEAFNLLDVASTPSGYGYLKSILNSIESQEIGHENVSVGDISDAMLEYYDKDSGELRTGWYREFLLKYAAKEDILCPRCSTRLPPSTNFCGRCGFKITRHGWLQQKD